MTAKRPVRRHPALVGITARLTVALVLVGAASAQTLYRSTDAEGATTYSDRPVPEAVETETVEVPPSPSDAAVEQSRQRATRQRELADELVEEREAKRAEQEAAKRDRAATPPPAPTPAYADESPYYGYPYHPRPPGRPHRPRYPYEWEGPGDHPAFRPPGQRPRPPPKPTPLPAAGGTVKP